MIAAFASILDVCNVLVRSTKITALTDINCLMTFVFFKTDFLYFMGVIFTVFKCIGHLSFLEIL